MRNFKSFELTEGEKPKGQLIKTHDLGDGHSVKIYRHPESDWSRRLSSHIVDPKGNHTFHKYYHKTQPLIDAAKKQHERSQMSKKSFAPGGAMHNALKAIDKQAEKSVANMHKSNAAKLEKIKK